MRTLEFKDRSPPQFPSLLWVLYCRTPPAYLPICLLPVIGNDLCDRSQKNQSFLRDQALSLVTVFQNPEPWASRSVNLVRKPWQLSSLSDYHTWGSCPLPIHNFHWNCAKDPNQLTGKRLMNPCFTQYFFIIIILNYAGVQITLTPADGVPSGCCLHAFDRLQHFWTMLLSVIIPNRHSRSTYTNFYEKF